MLYLCIWGYIKPSTQLHQVSSVQALFHLQLQSSIFRPGAFPQPVTSITPTKPISFVMFVKTAIFFFALATFAAAAPTPTGPRMSHPPPIIFSHSHKLQRAPRLLTPLGDYARRP